MQLNLDPPQIDIVKDIDELLQFDEEGISYYLNDPFTFNKGILIENNKVVGAGVLRVINEFKMVLDPSLSPFKRSCALKLMLDEAIKKAQCNEIKVLITKGGLDYSKILMNHYDFQFDPGILLRLEK